MNFKNKSQSNTNLKSVSTNKPHPLKESGFKESTKQTKNTKNNQQVQQKKTTKKKEIEEIEVEKVEETPDQTEPIDLAVVPTSPPEDWGVDAETQVFLKKSMADPKYEWKQPIEFYGKVVTLDGQPLEGVAVEYGWTSLNGYDKRTVQSDANGLFDLTDVRGKSMTIKLEKEGYDWFKTRTQRHFEFAEPYDLDFHEANPEEPLIYYMQERPEAEPLHAWRTKRGVLTTDEGSIYYNYITGTFTKSKKGTVWPVLGREGRH